MNYKPPKFRTFLEGTTIIVLTVIIAGAIISAIWQSWVALKITGTIAVVIIILFAIAWVKVGGRK